ncbi:ATP-binding protein [Streptomyces olivaceus]|uniref:MarR family transcriptional regulator n=1 Tax=Streptomyces olivaceus TaxID=47716 RepID=UPI001CCB518E|nr:helix-turn-helix domain-containing protein [Streptomyces olivaceus]MBZ6296106.1 ATP-binding protein [Streptomyces olivaceus]
MDLKAVSTKIADGSKHTAGTITNTLDTMAPTFAPFAARWDAEADRRRQLRTPENLKRLMEAQKNHASARSTAAQAKARRRNLAHSPGVGVLNPERRAARTADKAARQHARETLAKLKEAKTGYPATLRAKAIQAHAVHAIPGAGLSALGWDQAGAWPVAGSLALIAANFAALAVGRRKAAVVVDDEASAEERQLMERLHPTYWVEHAPDRGLSGTVTGVPQLGGAGITVAVRLDGQWDLAKFAAAESHVRALLGCRTALRLRVTAGDRGGWAVLTLGTRTAVDGASLLWTPDRQGIGLDTGTGEVVTLPHGRKVIAGTSGAGKSVLLRAILAPYALDPLSTVIYLDAKGEESGLWRHCAREAIDPGDIAGVVAEVVAEMLSRRDLMRDRQIATWRATEERPRLVVLVDEGADLMAMDSKKVPILPGLEQIARQGRSRLVDLLWCTQKPTVGDGIPSQIIGNMDVRVTLKTAGQTETQQIMGKGWQNHMLPGPGLAFVRGTGRDMEQSPVAVWDASQDKLVTSLPARTPWRREESPARSAGASVPSPLRLVKDEPVIASPQESPAAAVPPAKPTNREKVAAAIGTGARTVADVALVTGINKGSVSKAVKQLLDAGEITRSEDGVLSVVTAQAGAVSA